MTKKISGIGSEYLGTMFSTYWSCPNDIKSPLCIILMHICHLIVEEETGWIYSQETTQKISQHCHYCHGREYHKNSWSLLSNHSILIDKWTSASYRSFNKIVYCSISIQYIIPTFTITIILYLYVFTQLYSALKFIKVTIYVWFSLTG